ncbi:MAG: aldehyde dehydrogenase family protein [Bacteroidales bacterium]|nr:aldehyde dehydrogenase family protein [Bacteroidales bacterium]
MTEIEQMIAKAREAQAIYAKTFDQERADMAVKATTRTIFDHAEELAKMAVEETEMGVYEHKVAKNRNKAKGVYFNLKGKKSMGILSIDDVTGLIEVAKPMGVVAGVTPMTNPIVTPMSKIAFALKTKNAIIISPHPKSKKCSGKAIEYILEALKPLGVPEGLIQMVQDPSIEKTQELMAKCDVTVATGGMAMVKSAYSSGKPSYGVGAGNVQVILDRDIDYMEATDKFITGRSFDNGIICTGEQSFIYPEECHDEVMAAVKANGGYVCNKEEREKVIAAIFQDGHTARDVVGQSPAFIAKKAGITIPEGTRVIVVESNGSYGRADDISKEKMCPVMGAFPYKSFDEAILIAETNLQYEGNGHSVAIHSNNQSHIIQAGEELTVSRVVVNAVSATTAGGHVQNGLATTNTLGCGSWGNNSISENFTYKHLLNITRIAPLSNKIVVPSDEEMWK